MNRYTNIPPKSTLTVLYLLFAAAFFILPDSPARAETIEAEQWDISADKMTRYENPPSIIAEGNVVLQKTRKVTRQRENGTDWSGLLGDREDAGRGEIKTVTSTEVLSTIKADWIAYDVDRGSIKARGNLQISIGPDSLSAESGTVNLNSETGTFHNATIIRQDKNLHLEGRVIEKTGELTYHIEDGWVITCKLKDNEIPPWSFGAGDADITDGGYAILRHTTFRIKDVPVLYSPWMLLPVKRTRQTGFLLPGISSSDNNGFGISLPFFVNLSPSSDLTVYPEYLSNRGLMAGLEFRYVKDQQAKGGFMVNYLHDDLTDPSEVDYYRDGNYTHTNKDRYWLRGKADHNINGWITRLDLDIVSDRDYLTEFTSGQTGFNTSNRNFLEVFGRSLQYKTIDERANTLRFLKAWNDTSLEGEFLGINDLRVEETSPTPLWKLPSLNYTGLIPLGDTLVNLDWDAAYVNYWREDGIGAHRIDIFPRLFMPLPLGDYLEATANLGVRDTIYFLREYGDAVWDGDDTKNRFLVDASAEVGSTMTRDFNMNLGNIQTLRHSARPYVKYRYISDDTQEELPYFDNVDRIDDLNLITYGFDNYFDIFGALNNKEYKRQYGIFKLEQGYDLRSQASDRPLTPLNLRFWYYPLRNLWLLYKTDIDMYGEGILSYSIEGRYTNSRGDSVYADYRYNKPGNIDSITARIRVNLLYNFFAAYGIERSNSSSQTIEENISLVYKPSCWSVELSSNSVPGNQTYMITFRLANIGEELGLDLPGF